MLDDKHSIEEQHKPGELKKIVNVTVFDLL